MSERFGFTVSEARGWDKEHLRWTGERLGRWQVTLPHQCDDWQITSEPYGYAEHDQAIADLERFITEAQEALIDLRAKRERKGTT